VLYKFSAILQAHNVNLYAYLGSDYKVIIVSLGATFTLDWNSTALMRMMGFRDDLAASDTYIATDTIGGVWIPPYYSADTGRLSDDTAIAGGNAIDGTFSGISLAPGNYTRKFAWEAVAAVDVYKAACEASFTYGGSTYYPEEERCLETFTLGALADSPTGTEGISIKGCYYIEDLDEYTGHTGVVPDCPATMDGGGHRLRLTSTPDNYTFCHLKPGRWSEPTPTISNLNSLYNVGVELITSINGVPTWSAP